MSRNSEPNFIDPLVERYFDAAEIAMKNRADMDEKVIAAAISKEASLEDRANTIGGWISRYSAARAPGGKGISRKVAAAAIHYFDDVRREPIGRKQIDRKFDELRGIVGSAYGEKVGTERKYLVVTSKLLWTRLKQPIVGVTESLPLNNYCILPTADPAIRQSPVEGALIIWSSERLTLSAHTAAKTWIREFAALKHIKRAKFLADLRRECEMEIKRAQAEADNSGAFGIRVFIPYDPIADGATA